MPNRGFYKKLAKAKRMPKTIFVSFYFSKGEGKPWSFGNNTSFTTTNDGISNEELRKIEKQIKEELGANCVIVLNYQIM
ncbi:MULTISPECIES: hypothetical protein [unclassified Psychrobacillus]|uniref:hypothetical protein n=1 Tax=unclassified Psychrobacillus TaxID=2636677 RepID=UPI0030F4C0B3